jgi:hypothetical protein
MKRTTAAALLIGGALTIGGSAHQHNNRFSNSAIFDRQKPLIERRLRRDPEQMQSAFRTLRTKLRRIDREDGDNVIEKKCRFETDFKALTIHDGDATKAKMHVQNQSFEPYEHCEPQSRLWDSATKWYSIAGVAAFVTGAFSLIASAFRRKESGQPPA